MPANQIGKRHALVGPKALWRMKRKFQMEFLLSVGLKPSDCLLDIGCGTLRGGIPIIQHLEPSHYFGVESRAEVLDEARLELETFGLQDKLPHLIHVEHIRDCDLGSARFEFMWAFSTLIHMTDEILRDTMALAKRHLSPDGIFYANVNIGEVRQLSSWQGFPVQSRPGEFYQEACMDAGLSLQLLGTLRDVGHVSGTDSQDNQQMLKIKLA
jgi:SAM-dependent methyltransferase